jgi:hypothetical protein
LSSEIRASLLKPKDLSREQDTTIEMIKEMGIATESKTIQEFLKAQTGRTSGNSD